MLMISRRKVGRTSLENTRLLDTQAIEHITKALELLLSLQDNTLLVYSLVDCPVTFQ
jgi:hypothetical protein